MLKFSKSLGYLLLTFFSLSTISHADESHPSSHVQLVKNKKKKKPKQQNHDNQQPNNPPRSIYIEQPFRIPMDFTQFGTIDDPREAYIDLVKKILVNSIYEDAGIFHTTYEADLRENGLDHPTIAHTMIGIKRLNNIHYCINQIIGNNIPGDCIETGVWRGGATILMRAILRAYNDKIRKVWVADSFEGLPLTNPEKYPADKGLDGFHDAPHLAVSLEEVRNNFSKYGLLDDQVIFLKGFFKDTLPSAPITQLSLLRLDGDLYESTMDALIHLYPKLSLGGYLIIDDFDLSSCVQAVNDYRDMMSISEPMIWIDNNGVFWKKERQVTPK